MIADFEFIPTKSDEFTNIIDSDFDFQAAKIMMQEEVAQRKNFGTISNNFDHSNEKNS